MGMRMEGHGIEGGILARDEELSGKRRLGRAASGELEVESL